MRRRLADENPERERRAGLKYVLFQLRVAAFASGCLLGIFLFAARLFPDGGLVAVAVVFATGVIGLALFEAVRRALHR